LPLDNYLGVAETAALFAVVYFVRYISRRFNTERRAGLATLCQRRAIGLPRGGARVADGMYGVAPTLIDSFYTVFARLTLDFYQLVKHVISERILPISIANSTQNSGNSVVHTQPR